MDFYFFITVVIAQIVIPTEELVLPAGTQTNVANKETETQLVIVEAIIRKCLT